MMDRHPGFSDEEQAAWNGAYHPMQPPPPGMLPQPPPAEYAYRYREDQAAGWVPAPDGYYNQHVSTTRNDDPGPLIPVLQYEQPYPEAHDQYMEEAGPSNVNAEPPAPEPQEKQTRGRKRTKAPVCEISLRTSVVEKFADWGCISHSPLRQLHLWLQTVAIQMLGLPLHQRV